MSGSMAWTTRKHTEERSVATRERRGAVDRWNLGPQPLYTVSVYCVCILYLYTTLYDSGPQSPLLLYLHLHQNWVYENRPVRVIGCFVLLTRVIKLRMRLVVYMARKGAKRKVYRVLEGKPEGKEGLEDQSLDMKKVIKWVWNKYDGKVWTGCMWFRVGEVMRPHKMG